MNQWMIYGIDSLVAVFEMYMLMLFYQGFFEAKEVKSWKKWSIYSLGVLVILGWSIYYKNTLSLLLVVFVVVIIVGKLLFEVNFLQNILFGILFLGIMIVGEIIFVVLMSLITEGEITVMLINPPIYFIAFLGSKFSSFILIKLILDFFKIKMGLMTIKNLFLILCFPVASLTIMFLLSKILKPETEKGLMILALIGMSFLVISNILIFYVMEKIGQTEYQKGYYHFLKNQLEQQKIYYRELEVFQKDVYKLWHDMRNRMIALEGYMKNNDKIRFNEEVEKFSEEFEGIENPETTGYHGIDAILNAKIKVMERSGIRFNKKIKFPKILEIEEMDLAILIGNLLDNGIEALLKQENEEKILEFYINTDVNNIFITTRNNVENDFNIRKIETKKERRERHGVGLEKIKLIAEKYDGELSLSCENNCFIAQIFLVNLPK